MKLKREIVMAERERIQTLQRFKPSGYITRYWSDANPWGDLRCHITAWEDGQRVTRVYDVAEGGNVIEVPR